MGVLCPEKGTPRQFYCWGSETPRVLGRSGDLSNDQWLVFNRLSKIEIPLLPRTRTVSKRAGMIRPRESF